MKLFHAVAPVFRRQPPLEETPCLPPVQSADESHVAHAGLNTDAVAMDAFESQPDDSSTAHKTAAPPATEPAAPSPKVTDFTGALITDNIQLLAPQLEQITGLPLDVSLVHGTIVGDRQGAFHRIVSGFICANTTFQNNDAIADLTYLTPQISLDCIYSPEDNQLYVLQSALRNKSLAHLQTALAVGLSQILVHQHFPNYYKGLTEAREAYLRSQAVASRKSYVTRAFLQDYINRATLSVAVAEAWVYAGVDMGCLPKASIASNRRDLKGVNSRKLGEWRMTNHALNAWRRILRGVFDNPEANPRAWLAHLLNEPHAQNPAMYPAAPSKRTASGAELAPTPWPCEDLI